MGLQRLTKLDTAVLVHLDKIREASRYLWERGWAERNAGNISLNLEDYVDAFPAGNDLDAFEHLDLSGLPGAAGGRLFYAKGTNERVRELRDPQAVGAIIRIDDDASGYRVLWGNAGRPGFRPTSEFISHLLVHLNRSERNRKHRVVIHTHPIELIAISHHPVYGVDGKALTRKLWGMLPEVRAFVPKGIGLIPYILPGSEALGQASVKAISVHDVAIWAKHGALATGTDALEAFDFIDVANKGAIILLKCLSAGFDPIGMTDPEMEELARVFKL